MRKLLILASTLALAALPVCAEEARFLGSQNARVYQDVDLAAKSFSPASVQDFLRAEKAGARKVESLVTAKSYRAETSGRTHVLLHQEVNGLQVYGAYVKAAFDENGKMVHLIDASVGVPEQGVQPTRVTAAAAVNKAISLHHRGIKIGLVETMADGNKVSFDAGSFFFSPPSATRVAIAMKNGSLQEGFLVETWTQKTNMLHHTLIGAEGQVLGSQLRTNSDSYNIFADHPGVSSQTVVNGPGLGNAESPNGWLDAGNHTTVDISGNNVHAYLDTDANNAPDGGGSTVSDGNFLTGANLSQSPATAQNKEVAVQNLFYFNNLIHDTLYRHGFDEGAGNFQNNNFGNGGNGNDAVNAEAQDGSGTNNANFSTPNDGSPGRMQMYVWTQTNPNRDGDLDSDIIWHEYGHGLTWRMIGNMSGPMSGAIGEGNSDVLAILMNDDDVVGEYSFNNSNGIRSAPYTNYGRTYGDFGGSSVHFDGEIYAATIWRLYELYQQAGTPLDTLMDDMIGGMNFTAAGPAMEDMRDGILSQVAGTGRECTVWEAFAAFGIGEGARARVKGGGPFGGGNVTVTESFTLPASCNGGGCVPTETAEVSCFDNLDNDCDGDIDGADSDCGGGSCTPVGGACTANSECCSNKCRGPNGGKSCK